MGNRWGNSGKTVRLYFFVLQHHCRWWNCSHEIKRCLLIGSKAMTSINSILKSRDITLPAKVHLIKAMVFPEVMHWLRVGQKESWVQKNWCFWTVVLQKTLESPLGCKVIQPVHRIRDQSYVFQYIGHLMQRADSFEKTLMLEKFGQEEMGTTEDKMIGWHHWFDEHGFEWTLGVGDGQRRLACCSSWGYKESEMTEEVNWTELSYKIKDKKKFIDALYHIGKSLSY